MKKKNATMREIKAAARDIGAEIRDESFSETLAKATKKHEDLKKHKFDLPELL